jgi:hypothetical protein
VHSCQLGKGAWISPFSATATSIMLSAVLTQLIDRVGEDGTVTPELFNDKAARIIGAGFFSREMRCCR